MIAANSPPAPSTRIVSIDALRGLVMVLMALDHVRDFFHRGAMTSSPTDLATTTPVLFLTRWVTHLCAPAFIFTAGLGAFLWWHGRRTRWQLTLFLFSRGLWLILLELTVMQVAYAFNVTWREPVLLLVLWVLGASMMVLAVVAWVPIGGLAAAALVTIGLHDLFDRVPASAFGSSAWIWNLLHEVGAFRAADTTFVVGYPLVPWIAVMAAGFSVGPWYLLGRATRLRWLTRAGLMAMLGFVLVRGVNAYGDPSPWVNQHSDVLTTLSFLDTTKYPPSLAFLLMTLGPTLLALAAFESARPSARHPLVVLGRVPLFFFVTHFFVAHAAAVACAWLEYGRGSLGFLFRPFPSMGGPRGLFPLAFGYELPLVYLAWGLIVVGLYPACRWYGGVKARRRGWWWSYL